MVESDEEQLEVLKNWWDENGKSLLVTIVIVLGGTFGYRAYESNVQATGEAASAMYQDMIAAASNVEIDSEDKALETTARSLGDSLKTDHADSTYAIFAALQLAKLDVASGELAAAQAQLEWALAKKPDSSLENIIRTRLARVLLATDDAAGAQAILDAFEPAETQLSSYSEVRGDVLLALGDNAGARDAYQTALDTMDDQVSKPLLELKLADIPVDADDA